MEEVYASSRPVIDVYKHLNRRTRTRSKTNKCVTPPEVPFQQISHTNKPYLALGLQKSGVKVTPINPKTNQRYLLPKNVVFDRYPEESFPLLFDCPNIGIGLGTNSNNIFAVICLTFERFSELRERLAVYVRGIIIENGRYIILLRHEKCRVLRSDCKDYYIRGSGDLIVSVSNNQDKINSIWYKNEGELIPSMSKLRIRSLLPLAKILPEKGIIDWEGDPLLRSPRFKQYLEWAYTYTWPKKTGNRARIVFLVMCICADLDNKKWFLATIRDLALWAGFSKETIKKYLEILLALGLIRKKEIRPNYFRYRLSNSIPVIHFPDNVMSCKTPSYIRNNHDAFCQKGLGIPGASIINLLSNEPQATKKDILNKTHLSPPTFRKHIEILVNEGMVIYEHGYWKVAEDIDEKLKAFATKNGLEGTLREKQEYFKRERRNYAVSRTLIEINRKGCS